MPIEISTDLFTILGVLLGIAGIGVAIFQTISARRSKHIYEMHCRDKCKEIVGLTRLLTNEVVEACLAIDHGADSLTVNSDRPFPHDAGTVLAGRLNGIRILTERLASYCERVNDEHEDTFGHPIFDDIRRQIPQAECLSLTYRDVSNPESSLKTREGFTGEFEQDAGRLSDEENYQELILEHNKRPLNCGEIPNATHKGEGIYPVCGDEVVIYLKIEKEAIEEISFEASGSAIVKGSASMMTDIVQGLTTDEALSLIPGIYEFVRGTSKSDDHATDWHLAFAAVRKIQNRIPSALLPWNALENAITHGD